MNDEINYKERLYNFIVNNHNLEVLESKIVNFNPFRVLAIENFEIRHSNVLAWLLNPKENHGLGDYFLKKVLSQAVLNNENILEDGINLMNIQLADFGDTIIKREEKNIDILLRSRRNKFLFLIENKIHSKESKNQLTKYLNYAKNTYPEYDILPILLTKTGDEPENNKSFGVLSHEIIYKLLVETLSLKKDYLTFEISNFIRFYIKTLEKTLGMNEELKDLCLNIYNEHKDAIDLIVETIKTEETSLKSAFESFKNKHNDIEVFYLRDRELWFLPNDFTKFFSVKQLNNWKAPYPFSFWISKSDEKRIKFHIEIGPFDKGEDRLKFILFLEKNGYKIRNSAKRLESIYTRIITNFQIVKDWSDKEELIEAVERIYFKNNTEIEKFYKVLKKYKNKTE